MIQAAIQNMAATAAAANAPPRTDGQQPPPPPPGGSRSRHSSFPSNTSPVPISGYDVPSTTPPPYGSSAPVDYAGEQSRTMRMASSSMMRDQADDFAYRASASSSSTGRRPSQPALNNRRAYGSGSGGGGGDIAPAGSRGSTSRSSSSEDMMIRPTSRTNSGSRLWGGDSNGYERIEREEVWDQDNAPLLAGQGGRAGPSGSRAEGGSSSNTRPGQSKRRTSGGWFGTSWGSLQSSKSKAE